MKAFLSQLLEVLGIGVEVPDEMTEETAYQIANALYEPTKRWLRENALDQAVAEGRLSPDDADWAREKFKGQPLAGILTFIEKLSGPVPEWQRGLKPLSSAQEHINKQLGLDRTRFEKYNGWEPAKRN